jgi:hypothetical protein
VRHLPEPERIAMSFLTENVVIWRLFALAVLIVSMVGPWTFDLLNVPAEYPCEPPVVRLYGDFCGYPLSGFETVKWAAGGFFDIFAELLKSNFAARFTEIIFLIGVLAVVLPFFSNLLLIMNRGSRRLQRISIIVWGIACLPTLTMFIFQSNRGQFAQFSRLLWGLWLYILIAMGTMIVEVLVLREENKPSMVT